MKTERLIEIAIKLFLISGFLFFTATGVGMWLFAIISNNENLMDSFKSYTIMIGFLILIELAMFFMLTWWVDEEWLSLIHI